jgi:LPXTG-motif cell wall-anchored protein
MTPGHSFDFYEKTQAEVLMTGIHKQDIPNNSTLFSGKYMSKRFRINLAFGGFLFLITIIGMASAADLGHAWEQKPIGDNFFSGIIISTNGSMVFSGGSQILVRSWDGKTNWGGLSGYDASMSADGNRIISALENKIRLLDRNGVEIWTKSMNNPWEVYGNTIRAVAISDTGSIVVAADNRGFIRSWNSKGEILGTNETDMVKTIVISPSLSYIVVTTETGLKFFSPKMEPYWEENTFESLDTFIAISADGSTVITSGSSRVSSHDKSGDLNWKKDVTDETITDMACSSDCSAIVLGSQDGNVLVLNQLGQEQWEYPAGSWIKGVGVSRDGSVIAAGTLDRTLYILNKDGRLMAKTTTETIIQPRSVAVSGDGNHIVVADQVTLYGFEFPVVPVDIPEEIFTPATMVTATNPPQIPLTTTLPTTVPPETMKTVPEKTGTISSSLNPYLAIVALSGLLLLVMRKKK